MAELQIPDDLKVMYAMQKQVSRSFRNEPDTVAIANRTRELIERIDRLTAENAAILKTHRCEMAAMVEQYDKLRAENADLKEAAKEGRDEIQRILAKECCAEEINALKVHVKVLSAPVSDEEWIQLHEPFMCNCDDTECSCMLLLTLSRETLTEWIAARLAAAQKAGK